MAISYPENYKEMYWHSVEDGDFPNADEYVLLSFENFSLPMVGRCEGNEYDGYIFYLGDEMDSCVSEGLFVNAWMPIPKRLEE